ncbi:hypothetical protein [Ensifer sp. SL37]|uniref:hypothetical protein n=1 Tax=Ensifer sp. SL37 TaxID=2995137 RepID=UPI002272FC16|nr:hypothetical protein [Ensifer sp. SL37]MCY1741777.1 hypothetical protein [Ensifer sp. SL37]
MNQPPADDEKDDGKAGDQDPHPLPRLVPAAGAGADDHPRLAGTIPLDGKMRAASEPNGKRNHRHPGTSTCSQPGTCSTRRQSSIGSQRSVKFKTLGGPNGPDSTTRVAFNWLMAD